MDFLAMMAEARGRIRLAPQGKRLALRASLSMAEFREAMRKGDRDKAVSALAFLAASFQVWADQEHHGKES